MSVRFYFLCHENVCGKIILVLMTLALGSANHQGVGLPGGSRLSSHKWLHASLTYAMTYAGLKDGPSTTRGGPTSEGQFSFGQGEKKPQAVQDLPLWLTPLQRGRTSVSKRRPLVWIQHRVNLTPLCCDSRSVATLRHQKKLNQGEERKRCSQHPIWPPLTSPPNRPGPMCSRVRAGSLST